MTHEQNTMIEKFDILIDHINENKTLLDEYNIAHEEFGRHHYLIKAKNDEEYLFNKILFGEGSRVKKGISFNHSEYLRKFNYWIPPYYRDKKRDTKRMPSLLKTTGDITIHLTSLESLGNVGLVKGICDLRLNKNLLSLGSLSVVEGSLFVSGTAIENLDTLEYVGHGLHISYSMNSRLENFFDIYNDYSHVKQTKIQYLPEHLEVERYISMSIRDKERVYIPKHLRKKVIYNDDN